ncbi:hypothetical protein AgCh_036438 [Apium graveolens]
MAFLHAQTNQQPLPLHLLPSPPPPPPCSGGAIPGNRLITLDLFRVSATPSSTSNFHLQLLHNFYSPISFTFDHNFLKVGDSLESSTKGQDSEEQETTNMSRRNGPKLDLKLNLSPPRRNPHVATPSRSATVSPTSPPSSCVSSEEDGKYSSSPEAASMVLVGCPRCLMYVMLSEEDPRCPKCKSTVLLDVLQDPNNSTSTNTTTKKSKN